MTKDDRLNLFALSRRLASALQGGNSEAAAAIGDSAVGELRAIAETNSFYRVKLDEFGIEGASPSERLEFLNELLCGPGFIP